MVHVGLTVPCLYYFYRFFSHRAGTHLTDLLSYEAAFCLMTLIYGALFFLLADLVRLLGRRVRYPLTLRSFAARLYRQGLPVFLAAALVAGYSLYHSRDLEVTSYSLALPRGSSSLSSLRAVLVADTHIGTAVKIPELEQMVATIQALEPDVVFYAAIFLTKGPPTSKSNKLVPNWAPCRPVMASTPSPGITIIHPAGWLKPKRCWNRRASACLPTRQ